jgi:hypothetical protein
VATTDQPGGPDKKLADNDRVMAEDLSQQQDSLTQDAGTGDLDPAKQSEAAGNGQDLTWLDDPDLSKPRLTSWLDKHNVSYKARDSKEDLVALVRANADKPAPAKE